MSDTKLDLSSTEQRLLNSLMGCTAGGGLESMS
jgi:hypothetical protein